jgi:S-adenosylmethionine:tRNA ribosyltransferase-isomerase
MELSQEIDETYFEHNGEVPLPPYIRKNLKDQHSRQEDRSWYQPHWAKNIGSTASPTASLHFTLQDLDELRQKGVQIVPVTLHVGLGTYLPVDKENLLDFQMHGEEVSVSKNSWDQILSAKKTGGKIWCLGTTSTRAVESVACGLVKPNNLGFQGETQLKILPGFEFQIVDILLTNFHQPKTTLLAMVSAFSSLENLKENYKWAIERKFRLFSYGDLSVWERSKSVL